jgi:TonB family protein
VSADINAEFGGYVEESNKRRPTRLRCGNSLGIRGPVVQVNRQKRVIVLFKVYNGGNISNIRIGTTSGVAKADNAALAAVTAAAPFSQLPAGARDGETIKFCFVYDILTGEGSGTYEPFPECEQ